MSLDRKPLALVKIGSNVSLRCLERCATPHWAQLCLECRGAGWDVILVASGAVAFGRSLGCRCRTAAAAMGQVAMMGVFDSIFSRHGTAVGQLLLDPRSLEGGFENACRPLKELLSEDVLPVINGNDLIDDPANPCDNDKLCAALCRSIRPELTVIVSAAGGVRDADGRILRFVADVDESVMELAHPRSSVEGSGGMRSKLMLCRALTETNRPVMITSPDQPLSLSAIASCSASGTYFGSPRTWAQLTPSVKRAAKGYRLHAPIDLRSDTLTLPSEGMRRALARAEVGDDCYGEDRTVRLLEERVAALLDHESAVFVPSGTMSNQLALRALTSPGESVLTDVSYHVSYFESCSSSDLARIVLECARSVDGILTVEHLERLIEEKPRGAIYAQPRLIALENSIAAHGGRVYPVEQMECVARFAERAGLAVHLDGARLLNAAAARGLQPSAWSRLATTVTICFAKALGAPMGSVLAGPREVIDRARRMRKCMGGGLHQAGFMAAAALYALEHHLPLLGRDHDLAKTLATALSREFAVKLSAPVVETNFVMIDLRPLGVSPQRFVDLARDRGVLLFPWTQNQVRAVTHRDLDQDSILQAAQIMGELWRELGGLTRWGDALAEAAA